MDLVFLILQTIGGIFMGLVFWVYSMPAAAYLQSIKKKDKTISFWEGTLSIIYCVIPVATLFYFASHLSFVWGLAVFVAIFLRWPRKELSN